MLKNYFKTAIRSLLRNKLYSSINVFGLSVGLACAMLIVLYVKDEWSFDRFFSQSEHIYRINHLMTDPTGKDHLSGVTGYLQGPHFSAKVPGITAFVRVQVSYQQLKKGDEVESQQVTLADSNFFSVFSFSFLSGDPRSALSDPHSMVVTESFAKQRFGTADAVGKTLLLKDGNKFQPYKVAAVTRDCPENSTVQYKVVMPLHVMTAQEGHTDDWMESFLTTYVVLAPDANLKRVNQQIARVYQSEAAAFIVDMERRFHVTDHTVYSLEPLTAIHLDVSGDRGPGDNGGNPVYSYLLSGIALFILLIACINFVNLTVARSMKRAKEIGIRKVVGGSRQQLIGQFLGESMLLSLAAFLLAILEVKLILPVFNQLANKALAFSYLLDAKLVISFIGLYMATGMLAGFYPALVLSGYDPVQTLYSRFRIGGKNYLQRALVILQFALASFVIMATAVLFSQFRFLTTEKLGYDDTNLITVQKDNLRTPEALLFRQELTKDADILGVAANDGWYSMTSMNINGNAPVSFVVSTIDEQYLPLMRIPMVAGRNFSAVFTRDTAESVLVNETFAKNAGWKNPIGQVLSAIGQDNIRLKVVGVVRDYHLMPLNARIDPQVFVLPEQGFLGTLSIRIRPNTEAASLARIQKIFRTLFPLTPFAPVFKNEVNQKSYESEARWKQILFFSAIITIVISCIGLFGLAVLSAEQRVKEIGIRKVLGASVAGVVRILSRDFLWLVLLSLIVAIPCAWIAANKWLQTYPYRITLNWELFALPCVLVVLIALVTIGFQALKAAMANPLQSLRSE